MNPEATVAERQKCRFCHAEAEWRVEIGNTPCDLCQAHFRQFRGPWWTLCVIAGIRYVETRLTKEPVSASD